MTFDSTTARNSIYLDFEGEGKSTQTGIPLPHMAGIFRPYQTGTNGNYEAVFFREAWKPAKNGSKGRGRIDNFAKTIESLINEAKQKNSCIVFWSDYERSAIELNTPDLLESFNEVALNLLPAFRTLKNRRKIDLEESLDKVLNQYVKAFLGKRPLVETEKIGPAESCRRIDKFSTKYSRWRNWPEDKKQYVNDLLNYNESDCRATWWLGKKLGNINESKE